MRPPSAEESEDTPPAGLSLVNLGPQLGDFDDTAAVTHLAGALGRPT